MKNLSYIKIASLIFMFFLLLSGCIEKINRTDAIGIYHSNHKHGEEILQVKTDGTYNLTYIVESKVVLENKNTWNFEYDKDGKPTISFKEYLFGYRDRFPFGKDKKGWWIVEVEKSWDGKIQLNTDPDLYYYFVKE